MVAYHRDMSSPPRGCRNSCNIFVSELRQPNSPSLQHCREPSTQANNLKFKQQLEKISNFKRVRFYSLRFIGRWDMLSWVFWTLMFCLGVARISTPPCHSTRLKFIFSCILRENTTSMHPNAWSITLIVHLALCWKQTIQYSHGIHHSLSNQRRNNQWSH